MEPLALIGFAEALAAPEVAWSLRDAGLAVHVLARRGSRAALRHSVEASVHEVRAPEDDFAQTLGEIETVASALSSGGARPVLALPLDDAAVWLFSRVEGVPSWTLVGPRGRQAELALDKRIQVSAACQAQLRVPKTTLASTRADVMAHAGELPVVIKSADAVLPLAGKLTKGRTWICASRSELERASAKWAGDRPLLIQPFIRGVGEGVFGLATARGVEAWSAHRRLRMMNPHGSGSSACTSQAVADETRSGIERLIRQTEWRGLFMVELLRDDRGESWFVEFNGRSWGSMALSRRQGLEYPAWAAWAALNDDEKGRELPAGGSGVTCQNAGRELMHLLFLLRGPQSEALREWPTFWSAAYAMLRAARTSHFYNVRRGDMRVFVFDTWYTLCDQLLKRA